MRTKLFWPLHASLLLLVLSACALGPRKEAIFDLEVRPLSDTEEVLILAAQPSVSESALMERLLQEAGERSIAAGQSGFDVLGRHCQEGRAGFTVPEVTRQTDTNTDGLSPVIPRYTHDMPVRRCAIHIRMQNTTVGR